MAPTGGNYRLETSFRTKLFATAACIALALAASPALALEAQAPEADAARDMPSNAEIIVTARKREESAQQAPVIVDVLTPQKLEQLHISDVYALNSVVPSLTIVTGGSFTGVTASIRGLGNGAAAVFADQTVALNLDGLSAPTGAFYRAGMYDLAQVEVLKGPQSLFFGKSTSGGVVVLHTADPSKNWDARLSATYEAVADELETQGFISGPITDSLGFRLAGMRSRSKGYLLNLNPATRDRRKQSAANDSLRATLLYDAGAGLRIKGKAFYARNKIDGDLFTLSNTICADAVRPFASPGAADDCELNRSVIGFPDFLPYRSGRYGPGDAAEFAAGSPHPVYRDGATYGEAKMAGAPVQIDVDLSDGLTLASLSGYQWIRFESASFLETAVSRGAVGINDESHEFSQELRLASDWKAGWFNFMAGGLYVDSERDMTARIVTPARSSYIYGTTRLRSKQLSAFGQLLLTPTETIELSLGARYTRVHRYFTRLENFSNATMAPVDNLSNVSRANRDRTENDLSPEITLSYRPSARLTLFGSYKEGYKAHSFNAAHTAPAFSDAIVTPYGGERVKGFEGGVKARAFDNSLNLTLTGYRYNYDDLQVSFVDTQRSTTRVANGADARIQGFELGADYSPRAMPGLALSAAVNYNDAYFRSFEASPCYASQTAQQGCITAPTGVRSQDQSGQSLPLAARWTGNAGVDYSREIGSDLAAGFHLRAAFTSAQQTTPQRNPLGYQKGYTLIDAGVRIGDADDRWTLSFACRNCTNKTYLADAIDSGVVTTPGIASPVLARLARPRQVMLELVLRPGRW